MFSIFILLSCFVICVAVVVVAHAAAAVVVVFVDVFVEHGVAVLYR